MMTINQRPVMKAIDTVSPEAVALTAACQLHTELLQDPSFAGYDGTKEQFDQLYRELFIIARDEVSLEVDPIDQVIETFFDYSLEIVNGDREVDWYLRVSHTLKSPMATATQLANDYIKANKFDISPVPRYYVTGTGRLASYNPVDFCANNTSYRRSYSDFRAENNAKEWMLLWVATHLKKELGWHLDHIIPLSKGGTNNVKNLRILPPSLNTGIGNLGLSNDELNEFIDCLTPTLRAKFGIPDGFRACSLKEFCKEYRNWV